jgi:guanosine-3',5'-bis(diphosphate) 3'-pyrophosphohydrolase
MNDRFEELLHLVKAYNDKPDTIALIKKAWEFACLAHTEQKRVSGELFISHPLETAITLAEWKMDTTSIVVGLLHDAIEWGSAKKDDIQEEFGEEVANLVNSVTKVSYAQLGKNRQEWIVENLRKMVLAMAKDLRVVIIRFAERLDNLKTLDALPQDRQTRIAQETLDIFAPLAERLGMGNIKTQFENYAFRYLYPKEYEQIVRESKPYYQNAEEYIKKMKRNILKHLAKEDITVKVLARRKHYYSIWKKLDRREGSYDSIHDYLALRILVPEVKDCYTSLGILHNLYKPVPSIAMRDFIAQPKPNGYQSIHTNVIGPEGHIAEVQIRTFEMHDQAEYGVAAHWAYAQAKSAGASDESLEKGQIRASDKLSWVKQLVKWHEEMSDSQEFLDAVKFDALQDRIYVFTPQGDVYDLPSGATPVDFAFAVHTGLGKYIRGAIVNKKIVPLSKKLNNGDVVEILKHKNPIQLNKDWLKFVATTTARRNIQKHLRNSR